MIGLPGQMKISETFGANTLLTSDSKWFLLKQIPFEELAPSFVLWSLLLMVCALSSDSLGGLYLFFFFDLFSVLGCWFNFLLSSSSSRFRSITFPLTSDVFADTDVGSVLSKPPRTSCKSKLLWLFLSSPWAIGSRKEIIISIHEKPIRVDKWRKYIWDENNSKITQEIWRETQAAL